MKTGEIKTCLLGALLCLLVPAGLMAQEGQEKKPDPPRAESPKPTPKPALAEATRASTDAAVKSAAQKKAGTSAPEDDTSEPNDSAVTELHPAAQTPEASSTDSPKTIEKKSPSRNIHGSVYGASGAGGGNASRSGGSVGATSKSGKTSVYVETDRSRQSPTTSK